MWELFIPYVIGVAGSATVAIIYGLFIAQKETEIRNSLSMKRRGWKRKRYVKAFIEAVKGRAAIIEIRLLFYLLMFVLYGSYVFLVLASNTMEERVKSADMRYERMKIETGLTKKPEIQPAEELRAIQESILELEAEWKNLKPQISVMIVILHIGSILCLLMPCICFSWWYPFIIMRRLFAHEIERFMLRIQGLANNEELVELTIAESQVTNETTLRAFVEVIHRVAMRHNISQLVKTFDLWRDNTTPNTGTGTAAPTLDIASPS